MDNYVMFNYQEDNLMEDYVKLTYGDNCPITGEDANPFKCSNIKTICSYLDGIKTRELSTMRVVDSIRCKYPEAKENG